MSTRELIFEYTTRGAKSAARADQQVRESVRQTGRAAQRNAGAVERWMDRNRRAIQAVAAASLAAVGSILSASPTLRSQLGGVRAAFTLFADQIVRDLLPAGTNFGSMAVDLARRFQDLSDPVRRAIGLFGVVGAALATLIPVASLLISSFATVASALAPVISALGAVVGAIKLTIGVLAAVLGVSASVAAGLAVLAVAVVALAIALITNIGGARDKVLGFLSDLESGTRQRMSDWATAIREAAARARDWAVGLVDQLKERTLALLSLGREMAGKGREWVAGLASGVRQRAGQLLSAFRSMASRAAQAFRDRFNAIIPSSISIPSVSINIPDILGGGRRTVGGGSLSLPQLDTGGRIASDGLAMLHAGERIMPAAQVRERGPQPTGEGGTRIEEVTIMVMGTGDARTDGRNVARAFQRELEDRGA